MNDDVVLARIASIRQHAQCGSRAPHKPLVLLWALARLLRGEERLARWAAAKEEVGRLLHDFGRPGQRPNPEHPFWRLQSDGFWQVAGLDPAAEVVGPKGNPRVGVLDQLNPSGGFDEAAWTALRADPALARRAAAQLLADNFPSTLHEDILAAVGMPEGDSAQAATKRRRNPAFRANVLRIYEYRCAVCGYDGRLGHRNVCLEAAHVRWHTHDGPDSEDNGLALCSFHHKALDTGAIGLDDGLQVIISQDVHGSDAVDRFLLDYNGAPLRGPQAGAPTVRVEYAQWHREEVFQRPPRAVG